jgi:hypothetical protein
MNIRVRGLRLLGLILLAACLPRLRPLSGSEAPAGRLPASALAPGHRKIVFTWELDDQEMSGRGEGATRIAAPDSARLDFFLAGGFGQGAAVLVGDSLRTPGGIGDLAIRLVPPPPMLWAALGRVALPNLPDTVIRIEGSTLRADIGRPVAWRLTFRNDTLTRAERVEGGRVVEWVDRSDLTHLRYRNEAARRSLQMVVTRTEEVREFDASIWRFDR